MKVYVVTRGEYSDYSIDKVFLDKEKAEKYAELYSKGDCFDTTRVEEYIVYDEFFDSKLTGPIEFYVQYINLESGKLGWDGKEKVLSSATSFCEFDGGDMLKAGSQKSALLVNCPQDKIVDHIDGNPLNNIKTNLKICTQKENMKNHHFAQNINYNKRDDLYTVSFAINGKIKYICYTRDIKEAEIYALIGRNLLKKNKTDILLAMPCKKIIPRNNKTGIVGVTQLKNGRYQAFFKGKHLGTYINIEDAKNARKQAEINYQLQNL